MLIVRKVRRGLLLLGRVVVVVGGLVVVVEVRRRESVTVLVEDDADLARRRLAAKLRDVRRDLVYLDAAWPFLVSMKVTGTQARWAQHDRRRSVLSAEQLEAMGHRGVPRPTPACVSVLDVLAEIQTAAVRIANEVLFVVPWQACVWRPAWSPQFDVRPWLRMSAALLPQAHLRTVDEDDPLAPWCERIVGATPDAAARLLGDVRSGQDLAGICPWCEGLTARGVGEPTLRVHYPDELDFSRPLDAVSLVADGGPGPLIVCHGANCTPPSRDCGMRWHGHPAWNTREWEWLAKRLKSPEGR